MMRPVTRILLTAVLLTGIAASRSMAQNPPATACPAPASQDLIGLWESRDVSKGGIGHSLEFRQNGTFVEASTVIVNVTYRVSGDQLSLGETHGDPASGEFKLRIEGDTLIQTSPDGSTLKKERVGQAKTGSSPIVGTWSYRHMTGAVAFEKYTEDGRMLFRLPLGGSTGCYQIAGDHLSMSKPDSRKIAITFELRTGELVLTGMGKNPTTYRRSEEGPWYDREHIVPL